MDARLNHMQNGENMVLGITLALSIIRNLVEASQCCILFLLLDKPRYSWKRTIVCYLAFILFTTALGATWVLLAPQSYGRFITLYFCFSMLIFFSFMSQCSISQILYNISLQVFVLLCGVFIGVRFSILFFEGNVWMDVLIRCIYFGVVVALYCHYLRQPYLEILDYMKARWKWMAFVALAGNMLFLFCAVYPEQVMIRSFRDRLVSSGIGIILFATHMTMLKALFAMQSEMKAKEEMAYSALNHTYLEREFAMIEERIKQADRVRHDARHHDLVIMEYARKGEIKELLRYLEAKEDADRLYMPVQFCENRTVNSILTVYIQRAEQAGIRMKVDAQVGQDIGIKDIDFTAILGNALENALHGCLESGEAEPFIDVKMQIKGGKLTLLVRNSCNGRMAFENGIPKSGKGAGIGIKSMLQSAQLYNGQTDFQCEEKVFMLRMVLKASSV